MMQHYNYHFRKFASILVSCQHLRFTGFKLLYFIGHENVNENVWDRITIKLKTERENYYLIPSCSISKCCIEKITTTHIIDYDSTGYE